MQLHYSTLFEAHADVLRDRPALKQGGVVRSWAEFDDRAARFGGALNKAGLRPGARVGQLLYNSPELIETYHGTLKIRGIPFNINYRYTADEILYILENAAADVLVFHTSLAPVVAKVLESARNLRLAVAVDDGGALPRGAIAIEDLLATHDPFPRMARNSDDPTMIFTGGTTGMPKGVVIPMRPHIEQVLMSLPPFLYGTTVQDLPALTSLAERAHQQGDQMIGLPLPPMVHGAALNIVGLPTLMMGGTLVLATGRHFDAAEAWALAEAERVTSTIIVGDAFARPLRDELRTGPRRNLNSLRLLSSAGAIFSADVKAELLAHMRPDGAIVDYVSATEAAMGISISTRGHVVETGRFTPNPGVILVDEGDRPLGREDTVPGRIAVPTSVKGYDNDTTKTAATFPVINGLRYAIPGDYAVAEADGMFRLLGRGSACINTGGLKVFPDEVEEAIRTHDAVNDVVVVGLPDERFGQRVAALIALTEPSETLLGDVMAAARRRLAGFKLPKTVKLVDVVPRNNLGKHDYTAARAAFDPAEA